MGLYTVELVDRCIERKDYVISIIEAMLDILKQTSLNEFADSQLPSHLGKALLEFMDGASEVHERRKLAEILNTKDLKQYFVFTPKPKKDRGRKGSFMADKF